MNPSKRSKIVEKPLWIGIGEVFGSGIAYMYENTEFYVRGMTCSSKEIREEEEEG
ncbi:hypothetical protein ACJROX_24215 [Pseudalkalibacillus sp. A8]|uniref:hypothetical protein n=1 Tax=Pseudalkalibacillus sp. A8 TaxID=3382641 RepID=UPI0038B5450A